MWALAPGQVTMKNPAWSIGLQSLAEISSRRLGFDGVMLQPVLSKLMAVGAGGRIDTVQDLENGDSVATLVVLLPSEYTGGTGWRKEKELGDNFALIWAKWTEPRVSNPIFWCIVLKFLRGGESGEWILSGADLLDVFAGRSFT